MGVNKNSLGIGLTKERIEKYLGYEINDFKVEEVWGHGKQTGISITAYAKNVIEHINIDF